MIFRLTFGDAGILPPVMVFLATSHESALDRAELMIDTFKDVFPALKSAKKVLSVLDDRGEWKFFDSWDPSNSISGDIFENPENLIV